MISRGNKEDSAKQTLINLKECHAILENDHFVYVSGHHGSGWINKDAIYPDTRRIMKLCKLLAEALADIDADVICGPAIGGLIVSQWTAYHLQKLSVFAEHDPSRQIESEAGQGGVLRAPFILKRGYDKLVSNRRVIVVDDIINTGFSALSTIEAVGKAGGSVVALAVLINRGNIDTAEFGVDEFIFLLEYDIPVWPASECNLCLKGVPINTDYGHGREFLNAKSR
jgi:orotate phosphoribosyltransferase